MIPRVLLLLFILFSHGAAAQVLKVGTSADYPPLTYRDGDRIVGIEADNALTVGKLLARPIKLVEMPFGDLIPALRAGEIDVIMSGLSVTPERSELVLFTEHYLQIGQMAIVHRDQAARLARPWSIYQEGVRIGVETGTTGAAFAQRELTEAEIKPYVGPEAAFKGLRDKEIDLFIHDAPTSWLLATSKENQDLISFYTPLTEEYLAWAVREDDIALVRQLNRALRNMKAMGTLGYILNRWIPVTVEVR